MEPSSPSADCIPTPPCCWSPPPGKTALCRYYVGTAEVWRQGGYGGSLGGAGSGVDGDGEKVRLEGAGVAVVGSTTRLMGVASSLGVASRSPRPPEKCGSGRARAFAASVRAVGGGPPPMGTTALTTETTTGRGCPDSKTDARCVGAHDFKMTSDFQLKRSSQTNFSCWSAWFAVQTKLD